MPAEARAVRVVEAPDGLVELRPAGPGTVEVTARVGSRVHARWTTAYPPDLIEHVTRVRGAAWTVDEIRREEDPTYIEHDVRHSVLAYRPTAWFEGARVLDFGCGSGASTCVLGRLLPRSARIDGVELDARLVGLARHRAAALGLDGRVEFHASAGGSALPGDLPSRFDAIVLMAVWEHVLADERRALLPALWARLRRGGVLFVAQTPWRWSPVEAHTTGLPLINYLPARLAGAAARRLSQRVRREATWQELCRAGIRGGSVREIARLLGGRRNARVLDPLPSVASDPVELWLRHSAPRGRADVKRRIARVLGAVYALTGVAAVPQVNAAFEKL